MERKNIAFSPPDIGESEITEVAEALKSGWITTGTRTKLFEKKIAEYCHTPMAVCLNSATAALEMTLRILGVGPGDEVITTAYTYTASASVVLHVGAKLVLVDTLPGSFEMDYEALEELITERTKVIIPVDLGGRMCNYEQLMRIVDRKQDVFRANSKLQEIYNRVIIMADSAHGFGASCKIDNVNFKSGQVADFTCFSFHAVKNLTTGEGGAVVWRGQDGMDHEWVYQQYMLMSLHGQNKDAFHKNQLGAWEYDIIYPAYKCNMTDIQAAIGLKQLERYPSLLQRRREIISKYDEVFVNKGFDVLKHFDEIGTSSGHLYLLRIPDIDEKKRNEIIVKMAEKGVATNVHYKPLPMMTAYMKEGFDIKDYPNAYQMYQNEITLPLHTKLSDDDVDYIIACLVKSVNEVIKDDFA